MKRHSRASYGRFVLVCIVWLLAPASAFVAFQASRPQSG